jgi:thioredoxin-dependent peroxiredoxin
MKTAYLALLFVLAGAATACSRGASAQGATPVARSGLVAEGAKAPLFDAVAHNGQRVSLQELRGRPVVLYFYPKDDTPGCTREACELRDAYEPISRLGAVIVGVSTQDNVSHQAFAVKHKLPFLLVPDHEGTIAAAYGVPLRLGLAKRVTFIIGRDGVVARVFPDVTPSGHAAEVLEILRTLPPA